MSSDLWRYWHHTWSRGEVYGSRDAFGYDQELCSASGRGGCAFGRTYCIGSANDSLIFVFLRILECFCCTLILTSNGVGTIDEAFRSSVQVALHLRKLTRPWRQKIWTNSIGMLGEDNEESELSRTSFQAWLSCKSWFEWLPNMKYHNYSQTNRDMPRQATDLGSSGATIFSMCRDQRVHSKSQDHTDKERGWEQKLRQGLPLHVSMLRRTASHQLRVWLPQYSVKEMSLMCFAALGQE